MVLTEKSSPLPPFQRSPSSEKKTLSFVLVHVSGEVLSPGVYRLGQGSRVIDGIRAAGGALPAANLDVLNLASVLSDGQRIEVPSQFLSQSQGGLSRGGVQLSLNRATPEELQDVPGIGKKTAQKILSYREKRGGFRKWEDLMDVPGVGPKTLEKMKSHFSL